MSLAKPGILHGLFFFFWNFTTLLMKLVPLKLPVFKLVKIESQWNEITCLNNKWFSKELNRSSLSLEQAAQLNFRICILNHFFVWVDGLHSHPYVYVCILVNNHTELAACLKVKSGLMEQISLHWFN